MSVNTLFPVVEHRHPHGFVQRGWDVGPENPRGTIVFVHGNPSSKFLFRSMIAAAKDHYRCIAPDHIGMGDSDKPDRDAFDFHFEQRVDDLEAFLQARNVTGPVSLVVHDWGGVIGLRFAQRHPEQVVRLVIMNTAAFPLLPGKKLPKEIALVRNTWIGGVLCKYANAFQRGAVWKGVVKTLPSDVAKGYLSAHRNAHDCEAILRFVRDIPLKAGDRGMEQLQSLAAFLPKLSHLPIQLQWGLRDFVFDADYLAAFQAVFPRAQTHAYEQAGHWLTEDVPEVLVPRFIEFLHSTEPG